MSGGSLTDYHYDLYRLDDWSREVRNHAVSREVEDEGYRYDLLWLSDLLSALSKCLDRVDYEMSGDIGEKESMKAIGDLMRVCTFQSEPCEGDVQKLRECARVLHDIASHMKSKEMKE